MTSERVKEIRDRLAKATPGPWYHEPESGNSSRFNWLHYPDPDDAVLIAHAPTDLAWACDEIERLAAENADIKRALERISLASLKGDGTTTECEMAHIAEDALAQLSPKDPNETRPD